MPSRILIADDNQPNRELLEAYLAEIDCDVATAVDGQDTLAKVKSFQPDLVLLDVMMPKLSGFEVCQKMKADPVTKKIMILMVTALNESNGCGGISRGWKTAIVRRKTKPGWWSAKFSSSRVFAREMPPYSRSKIDLDPFWAMAYSPPITDVGNEFRGW